MNVFRATALWFTCFMAIPAHGSSGTGHWQQREGISASSISQRHGGDVVDAIADYQRVSREHANDDPASFWVVWPGNGYRLGALDGGQLNLVALRSARPGAISYGIALGNPATPCETSTPATLRLFSLDGVRMTFQGACMGDLLVYRPTRLSDVARIHRRLEKGGKLVVSSAEITATFDLSGVPVLKTMFAAEAAPDPPAARRP
ncbi:hypothetical protein [Luteibacter sp.]|uniref:hypothetical protein n=1 Tax=Luteibacter sp. TaxID=1886636 RepID=UPI002F3E4795